jgi:hypothetical protein
MRREEFLLRCLAAIFAAQFVIYLAGAGACIYVGVSRNASVCKGFDQNLQRTFETALATVLALMGGNAMRRD